MPIRTDLDRANMATYREHNVSFDASSMSAFERAVEANAGAVEQGNFSGALGEILDNLRAEIPPAQKSTALKLLETLADELEAQSPRGPVASMLPDLFDDVVDYYARGATVDTVDTANVGAGLPTGEVPFKGDAGDQWYPALEKADEYARSLGYDGVRHEGTGQLMRGLGRPPVNAIEVQKIVLSEGRQQVDLGNILPEVGHLRTLKASGSLFEEMKALIDAHHGGAASTGSSAPSPQAPPSAASQGTVPFSPDAGDQWHPAMAKLKDLAQSLGLQDVDFVGSGVLARGLGAPPVNAIELQTIRVVDAQGQRHELGAVLPEAGHLQSLKDTDALFDEMKALVEDFVAQRPSPAVSTGGVVPFEGDAGAQWHPAIAKLDDYARSLGFESASFKGTGVMARGLGQPPVNAIEFQTITVVDDQYDRHEIGTVLPEASHLRELKDTDALFAEMKGLLDDFAGR